MCFLNCGNVKPYFLPYLRVSSSGEGAVREGPCPQEGRVERHGPALYLLLDRVTDFDSTPSQCFALPSFVLLFIFLTDSG